MYDGCEYPYFKQIPSDIDINLEFFDDYVSSILPLASFNTDSIKIISGKDLSFMRLIYDKYKYSSRLEFDLKKLTNKGIYNFNITLIEFKEC